MLGGHLPRPQSRPPQSVRYQGITCFPTLNHCPTADCGRLGATYIAASRALQRAYRAGDLSSTHAEKTSISHGLQRLSTQSVYHHIGSCARAENDKDRCSPGIPPRGSGNPQLVRTWTVQRTSRSRPGLQVQVRPFKPYSTTKALEIEGYQDAVLDNWTEDEREAHRRLVEFERTQL